MVLTVLFIVAASIAVLFSLTTWATRSKHARFKREDVESAIEEILSTDSRSHDSWDIFLNCPIRDPYLESIRIRCLKIVTNYPRTKPTEDIGPEGIQKIRAILTEMKTTPNQHLSTTEQAKSGDGEASGQR